MTDVDSRRLVEGGVEPRHPQSPRVDVGGDDVRAAAIALHAKRNDRGVLQEEEQIGNPVRTAILDELALERECLVVGHHAETADFELAHA